MKPEEREIVSLPPSSGGEKAGGIGQAGFTLIEMVITIVVIGIIAGISRC